MANILPMSSSICVASVLVMVGIKYEMHALIVFNLTVLVE